MNTPVANQSKTERSKVRLRGLGIFWAVLGLVAIATSFVATLATMLIFGVFLLLAGIAQFAYAFAHPSSDRTWHLITGALYSLVGLLLIVDPISGAIGLTFLLAILFLVRGAVQLAMAATGRRWGRSPGWHFIGGLLSLLLAILIIAGLPEIGTWVIGLFVGIELLLAGLTLLMTPEVVIERRSL